MGRAEAKEGWAREGHVVTPPGEGNRRLQRRRLASLETCGGPEGGTREPLTGSLPGLCGAVGSGHSFRLAVSRVWRPCCVRHTQSRGRSRDAAVQGSGAEGGPGTGQCPCEAGSPSSPRRLLQPAPKHQARQPGAVTTTGLFGSKQLCDEGVSGLGYQDPRAKMFSRRIC